MSLHVVILAAGKGKRMHSKLPKVLHQIAGKSMLEHVVNIAEELKPDEIHVVIGHGRDLIQSHLKHLKVTWVIQEQQLGTGHAVAEALPGIPENARVLVLSADVPLIQKTTLKQLIRTSISNEKKSTSLVLLSAILENPYGLGRIVRDTTGHILSIVEEKDANAAQKAIKEIYSGICVVKASSLARWLPMLNNSNAQGEFYLTEMIQLACREGLNISAVLAPDSIEVQGVNNRLQLHSLERILQGRIAEQLLLDGTSIADPKRFDLRGELVCGRDVYIDINVVITGKVSLGNNCKIGPNCVLKNVQIGDDTEVFAHSVLEDAVIAEACQIGPFARIRPGTELAPGCKIGNFVETKNAVFANGSKASHLAYIGDTKIGKNVNIGAGTITCNYDGVNKHQTIIEDGVFIGSDTQLVAPVTIGKGATIGAGSTIRKDAPADALTLSVNTQRTIYGWKRPEKAPKD